MGVYLEYNSFTGKWEWRGFGFRWQYDTKEADEQDGSKVVEEHMNRLKANQFVLNLLVGLRYR